MLPPSRHDVPVVFEDGEQSGNIGGVVLAVPVHGDDDAATRYRDPCGDR